MPCRHFCVPLQKISNQVNLIIEQGNTSSKVAVYDNMRQEAFFSFEKLDETIIAPLFDQFPLTRGIFSTVIDQDETLLRFLKDRLPYLIRLDETVPLPIKIAYRTPATLGRDRIAAAVGSYYLQPGRNLLVIDAGTAITYDIVEASGIYKGGNISPGLTTRFRALHQFTKKLPLLSEEGDTPLIGTDTETAIRSGVVHGIVFEMDHYIDTFRQKYPDLLVFLTGGHSFYFERRLKNSIFADINLVLTGLNRILEYNVEDL